jgi:hypothetical protein
MLVLFSLEGVRVATFFMQYILIMFVQRATGFPVSMRTGSPAEQPQLSPSYTLEVIPVHIHLLRYTHLHSEYIAANGRGCRGFP